ncbi:MAG: hypothetical protein KDA25_04520 [Phycisphaerales bacterium]|nr:hypothetical protein [Phycisphaerales bacterium]
MDAVPPTAPTPTPTPTPPPPCSACGAPVVAHVCAACGHTEHPDGESMLPECPQCGYSLIGLPSPGQCPECGFGFDERTFTLRGVPRGMRMMSPWRALCWILIAVVGWFALQIGVMLTMALGAAGFGIATILVIAVLAGAGLLIMTSRRERSGVHTFAFTPLGFGPIDPETGRLDAHFTTWDRVHDVDADVLGPHFTRLRLGTRTMHGAFVVEGFDCGVRCAQERVPELVAIIESRIAEAHANAVAAHPPTRPS